jgi:hypothetical protein
MFQRLNEVMPTKDIQNKYNPQVIGTGPKLLNMSYCLISLYQQRKVYLSSNEGQIRLINWHVKSILAQ